MNGGGVLDVIELMLLVLAVAWGIGASYLVATRF
jgi:hypothetical protein